MAMTYIGRFAFCGNSVAILSGDWVNCVVTGGVVTGGVVTGGVVDAKVKFCARTLSAVICTVRDCEFTVHGPALDDDQTVTT